jgi:hypothetical protein
MGEFAINELLQRRGLDLDAMRLVRHDQRALAEWRRGIAFFDHFVSYQKDDNRTPYMRPHSCASAREVKFIDTC